MNKKVKEERAEKDEGQNLVGLRMSGKMFFNKHPIDDHVRRQDPQNTKYNI